MRLHTERLLLRAYADTDAAALCEAKDVSHDHLKPWMPWAQERPTLEKEYGTIAYLAKKEADGREWTRGLFLHDGTFIGSSGYKLKDVDVPSYEIGYWLDVRHTGKGYMQEAVRAQTDYLFKQRGANRVFIQCHAANTASAKVARALEFVQEAMLRNERRHIDGTLADSFIFAHTPESWQNTLTKRT
ncbi:MAG: GNAT family N-acetyltransferase [Blastochloris viridis]|uniref:GNAT family N-acetyltransferase n=1 Tax=Blastochloris viridis TaxID=1079 RepID=A0A6N4R9Q8_BLAVI|nr:MAG: GNAT family N-acetyltransferase [Blastochloris viridis]